jgi:hypothetical protein
MNGSLPLNQEEVAFIVGLLEAYVEERETGAGAVALADPRLLVAQNALYKLGEYEFELKDSD